MRRLFRVCWAMVGVVLACLLAVNAAVPASANSAGNSNPNNYLALGDSVPFGYNPLLVHAGVASDVFVGYPELAAALFRPKLKVSNASCPGETSASLINGSGSGPGNGCQYYRQFIGALHVSYPGSQLQYAQSYVAANPRTRMVSLTVGANDLFGVKNTCEMTVPAASVNDCVVAGLPALLAQLAANLTVVYQGLRDAGFTGDFVAVTYYSTDYRDPFTTAAVSALNAVLADVTTAFGGKVADGFTAFKEAAAQSAGDPCAAGLLIHLTPTNCDIHPSPAGAALLAAAVRSAEGPN